MRLQLLAPTASTKLAPSAPTGHPLTQQQLAEVVLGAGDSARVAASAGRGPHRVSGRRCATAAPTEQHRAIGVTLVTGPPRNEGWRQHEVLNAYCGELPVEPAADGFGLTMPSSRSPPARSSSIEGEQCFGVRRNDYALTWAGFQRYGSTQGVLIQPGCVYPAGNLLCSVRGPFCWA